MQFQNKDRRGFADFRTDFAKHSALGSANTLCAIQNRHPTIYSLKHKLAQLKVPVHVISGDEYNNCLEPGIFIKRTCKSAWLTVMPATGHAVNREEPDLFNRITADFLTQVDSGRWKPRDKRSINHWTMKCSRTRRS